MHWISWDRLSVPKEDGGLGFKDLESFNIALLAKQVWRIMQGPGSLVSRILRGRYLPQQTILNGQLGTKPSYIWRSLMEGLALIRKGMCILIGNGQETKVWTDQWLPVNPRRARRSNRGVSIDDISVNALFHQGTHLLNHEQLDLLFVPEDAKLIKDIKLSPQDSEDVLGWNYTDSGNI